MRRSRPLLATPLLFALACGDDTTEAGPARHVLSDGTVVVVETDGRAQVETGDGRLLVGLSGRSPRAHSFRADVTMQQGFFTFQRLDAAESVFDFEGSGLEAGAVVLRYASGDGARARVVIAVSTPGEATSIRLEVDALPHAGPGREVSYAIPLGCDEAASFAGFGAQYNHTDQRGEAFPLWVGEQGLGREGTAFFSGDAHTTYFPMPYWLDYRGFGALVETHARVLVDLCARDVDTAWVEVERREPAASGTDTQLALTVLHGPTPAEVVRQLGDRVGRPPRPPEWAFSPWMAIQRGRAAVEDEVAALRAAEIPFSAVWVQDWIGGKTFIGDLYDLTYRWVADEELYPDLAGLVAQLRADDIRFLGYANPFVIDGLDHFDEMAQRGMLPTKDGAPYPLVITFSTGTVADLTNPETVDYIEGYLRAMVRDLGFDGWMADFGEWLPYDAEIHAGQAPLVHNDYPRLWHGLSRRVMDAERPDGDWVVFSRSGWTGDQAVQQIVWIGDQEANFLTGDGLPTVVPALLNLGLSATPFVTHDIAGYSGGPSTKELFFRWTELGAFTTFMRTHDGLSAALNWRWSSDPETTAHFRRFARIHEALVPELVALADVAAVTSLPPMRHLALVFPEDPGSREVSDQFLLGDDLLVAPIVHEGQTRREVYLPPGTWQHVWTTTTYDGPGVFTVDAPLGSPPVFSRGRDRDDLRAIWQAP